MHCIAFTTDLERMLSSLATWDLNFFFLSLSVLRTTPLRYCNRVEMWGSSNLEPWLNESGREEEKEQEEEKETVEQQKKKKEEEENMKKKKEKRKDKEKEKEKTKPLLIAHWGNLHNYSSNTIKNNEDYIDLKKIRRSKKKKLIYVNNVNP